MKTQPASKIIRELLPGKFLKLEKVSPCGTLEIRNVRGGETFYWRVTNAGKTTRFVIGIYDPSAPPKGLQPTSKGFSIQAAIRAAEVLAHQHDQNKLSGGYSAVIAEKKKAFLQEQQAQEIQRQEKQNADQHTLKNLLVDYCNYLQELGRKSHSDARSIFNLHIFNAWPAIANLPANQVTVEQVADMMRLLLEKGKGRTSNKLRSYARSAYQIAKASRSKASVPLQFKAYQITHNPVADTEPDESQNKTDKNPLSKDELQTYWRSVEAMPGFKGAVLRLHLLTGGQRIEQLVNLKTSDVSIDAILLYDGKGRPGKAPKKHLVPLIPHAALAISDCQPGGLFAVSTDGGRTHLSSETMSEWAAAAGSAIPNFQTKRIRSGIETLLAGAKISKDDRGRLQSHGISGVQARHYDGHDYIDEKRCALETLFEHLKAPEQVKAARLKTVQPQRR